MFTISAPNVSYGTRLFVSNFPSLNPISKSCSDNASCVHESRRHKRTSLRTNSWSQLDQSLKNKTTCRSKHRSIVSCNATSSESGDEGDSKEALEAVLKLYGAIKNRNIFELSDLVCDDCRCVCNLFSFFQLLQGKQKVLDLFNYVIKILGDHIEFIVYPTLHDGMAVAVAWKLEWNNTNVTLGKGFSFHVCHAYKGKILIRHVEMFMEPLLHIEPIRLKIMELLTSISEEMSLLKLSKDRMRKVLFATLLMAIIVPLIIWICATM